MIRVSMDSAPNYFYADKAATYRIRVKGRLDGGWIGGMWEEVLVCYGSDPTSGLDTTELVGQVRDQAALIGVINALYNNGYTVLAVVRFFPTDEIARPDETNET